MDRAQDQAEVEKLGREETKDLKTASVAPGETALDADEAFLQQHDFGADYLQILVDDKQKNRRLVRKIDLILLPLLAGTFTLQYIDKQALSYAAVFDLFADTHMNGDQYAWLPSVFYFAYLAAEYPLIFLAQKWKIAKVVSICVLCWGAVLMLTAACSNYSGMVACRFFLGWFEAPITTCFMMIVSQWYLRSEQPFRAGVFYCCNGLGAILGGLFSYGMGHIPNFAVWRAIFLLCGGVTIIWGVVLFLFLPDSIIDARYFNVEEKALLIGRARLGRTGVINKNIKWDQIKEALMDAQVWLLTLFVLLNEVINGGVANFGKLIVKGLVNDPLQTTLLGLPTGAFQLFWILSGTYLASKLKGFRTIIMALYQVPTIIGISLIWKLDRSFGANKYGVLLGYYIQGSFVATLVIALQMPSSNVAGYTKRMVSSAIVFTAYCVGNIIGPHAFRASEAPLYPTGCKVLLSCTSGQFAIALVIRYLLIRRNKKREAAGYETAEISALEAVDGTDTTDFKNPHFRYLY